MGGYGPALAAWVLAHWPAVANAAFVAIVARVQLAAAKCVVEQESAPGPASRIVRLYFAWTCYTVWYFHFLADDISAVMYAVLGCAQLTFLLACYLFEGTFNYDRRRDRIRWKIIRLLRRIREPLPGDFFAKGGIVNTKDYPLMGERPGGESIMTRAAYDKLKLPVKFCPTCGDETHHDFDGFCMVCNKAAGSSMGSMNN